MAGAEATEISDSEHEAVGSPKNKSTNGKKASMAPGDDMSEEQVDEGSDAGSADGSEYEIESIITSKRSGTGFTYLVSWKGYSAEHNSWVEEKDAGNAGDLITEYWDKNAKEKKARKSVDKPKTASKAGRKSGAHDTSTEAASTSAAKKRARSKAKKDDSDVEADSDRPKSAKKPRKSMGTKKSSPTAMDVDDDVGNMEKYIHHESWEKLIKNVDTVEKGPDNKLYVFFTLKTDNERHKQLSATCKKMFPQHLLDFYEGHLRWKEIGKDDD